MFLNLVYPDLHTLDVLSLTNFLHVLNLTYGTLGIVKSPRIIVWDSNLQLIPLNKKYKIY